MSYIIVRVLSPFMAKTLYKFGKNHPELIAITTLAQRKKELYTDTIFFKDNGLAFTYIAGLMEKYPDDLEVCGGTEMINRAYFPTIISKGAKWLAQHNHNKFSLVAKNIGTTEEELKKITLGAKVQIHSVKEEVDEMRKKAKEKRNAL